MHIYFCTGIAMALLVLTTFSDGQDAGLSNTVLVRNVCQTKGGDDVSTSVVVNIDVRIIFTLPISLICSPF